MEVKTRVRCEQCREEIVLEKFDNYLYYRNRHWHETCLIEREKNKKRGALKEEDVKAFIEEFKEPSLNRAKFLTDRNALIKYIQYFYEISVLPKYFINKLDDILAGRLEGMYRAIPPHHLLDMWRRKSVQLRRSRISNKKKSKNLKGVNLIFYEMAILTNKYDSYLEEVVYAKPVSPYVQKFQDEYVIRNHGITPNMEKYREERAKDQLVVDIINELIPDDDDDDEKEDYL